LTLKLSLFLTISDLHLGASVLSQLTTGVSLEISIERRKAIAIFVCEVLGGSLVSNVLLPQN